MDLGFVRYKPNRDTPLMIVVPVDLCFELIDNPGNRWCEIFIPPDNLQDVKKPWASIVVEPEHVFYVKDAPEYNMFWVNAGAVLKLHYKEYVSAGSNKRRTVSCASDTSEGVLARILQYEAYKNGLSPANKDLIYNAYLMSGLTMLDYMLSFKPKR